MYKLVLQKAGKELSVCALGWGIMCMFHLSYVIDRKSLTLACLVLIAF